jgi:hypothetical protein
MTTCRTFEIVMVFSVLAVVPACGGHCIDHDVGEFSCDGNTLVGCSKDDSGSVSTEFNCGAQFCRSPTPGTALCALHPDPDPACPASGTRTVCEADGRLADCYAGYIRTEYSSCGSPALCISDVSDNAFCALSSQPDPHCPQPPAGSTADAFQSVCGDPGRLLDCRNGYVISDKDCGGADLCHTPEPATGDAAICVASGSPDPRCAAIVPTLGTHTRMGCDGTLLLWCSDDFLISSSDCGAKGCGLSGSAAVCRS